MRIVLCYFMASHCDSMAFNLRISSFIVAFLRVRRWVVHNASMQFRHLLFSISSSAMRRAEGYKPLAKSLKNLNQNYKRLICFELDLKVRGAGQFLSLPSEKAAQ